MIVFPYLVALHTSIALMEIFGWGLAVAGLVLAVQGRVKWRDWIRRHRMLLAGLAALWLWVTFGLVVNPIQKPFLMQWGFMRWEILLLGITSALIAMWSDRRERQILWLWGALILITGAYAGLQFFTGIDFVRPGRGVVNPQGGGVFKAVGFFSMSLTFAYSFGISVFSAARRGLRQWGGGWGALIFAAGIMGIVASMSRGAWIAALSAFLFYLAMEKKRWFWPIFALTVVGVFGASLLHDGVGDKIRQMISGTLDHSALVRVHLWRAHWAMFVDHPFLGVGLFESDKLLPEYFARLGIEESFYSHAHSNYLQWLAGTGLPGFLLYMYIAGFFLRGAWSMRGRDGWGWGLFLAQVFFHVGGLTEASFFDGEVNHFLVFIWALTWARLEYFTVVSPAEIKRSE